MTNAVQFRGQGAHEANRPFDAKADAPSPANGTTGPFDDLQRQDITHILVHVLMIVAWLCDLDLGNKEAGSCQAPRRNEPRLILP